MSGGPRSGTAEYMREYRRRRMPGAERSRLVNNARQRALTRLAARHPEELAVLFAEERAGIDGPSS